MGYILPVKNFQYYDYHSRIIDEKKNPYYIDKPFKAVLEAQYEDIKNHPVPRHVMLNKEHAQILAQKRKSFKTYADLTGKGKLFNELV